MEGEEELYDDTSKKVTTPARADVVKSFRPSPSSPNSEPADLGTMDTQTTGAKPAVKSTFRRQPPKPLATTRCSASCDRETPRLPGLDPQASLRIHHPQPPQQPMPMQPSLRGRRPGILALPQIRADRPSKQQEHAAQARATHAVASAGDRIRHPRTSTHHRPPSHADGAARALRAPVPCTSTDLQQLHPRILATPDRRQLHRWRPRGQAAARA